MPINKKRAVDDNNNNKLDTQAVQEKLEFLQKRVVELVNRLELIEDDLERLTFVMALFSKYMQYYSTKNNYIVDKIVIEHAIISTNVELDENYDEKPITEYEEEFIIAYLEKIQEKMFDISDEELEKWK